MTFFNEEEDNPGIPLYIWSDGVAHLEPEPKKMENPYSQSFPGGLREQAWETIKPLYDSKASFSFCMQKLVDLVIQEYGTVDEIGFLVAMNTFADHFLDIWGKQ